MPKEGRPPAVRASWLPPAELEEATASSSDVVLAREPSASPLPEEPESKQPLGTGARFHLWPTDTQEVKQEQPQRETPPLDQRCPHGMVKGTPTSATPRETVNIQP